jgi:hypothetical protein
MDVGTILLAAASVLGTKAIEESTKLAVGDMWSTLKSTLARKRGADSPAIEVFDAIERLPSDARPDPALAQRIDALALPNDPEVDALLQRLEEFLRQRAPTSITAHNYFAGGTFHHTTFN